MAFLSLKALERWLWDAACAIRGPVDAPKFKDYILPLIFLKRLSDVFHDEVQRVAAEFGVPPEQALKIVDEDHALVRFYIPPTARWATLRDLPAQGLGQRLTDAVRAVAHENPRLSGVIDITDFNATTAGQRIVDDPHLHRLIQVLSQHRLGLDDVEPDILGRAYEYLLRKFAEGAGQSAGEFYTPRMVGVLMARILDPEPGMSVYDPTCGSGGLLVKTFLRFLEEYGEEENGRLKTPGHIAEIRVFGQDINASAYAMAWMNVVVHDIEDADIRLGDTMREPAFVDATGSHLRRFDLIVANPMWNQNIPTEVYEHDPYNRFPYGVPPASSADWGWVQHMVASLNDTGRMAVVLDTGAVSRGSGTPGSHRERDIRKRFIEGDANLPGDLIEAVILLPENLFYNTTAPGIIMVINKQKRRPGEILLINASRLFVKGRPKNELTDEHVEHIARLYHEWREEEDLSRIITTEEAAANDYNLSPSRYVAQNDEEEVLPLEEAVVRLREAEEARTEANRALREVLRELGLDWQGASDESSN